MAHDLIVIGITLGWLSKISPFRASVMWQKRIGQLVNRQVSAPGFLVAVSSVIFRIQKNYHMATRFWKNDFYTYYDLIVNPTAPDLYIHLGWVIFRTTKFFSLSPISMTWTLPFRFSQISGVFADSCRPVFLNYFRAGWWIRNGNIFDDHLITLPLILPSTIFIALLLLAHHHHCLFILRSEKGWCFYLFWIFSMLS